MTITVTHAFVSGVADDPTAAAAGEVLPSHWNANHIIGSGGTDKCIIFDKAGVFGEDTNLEWDYTNKRLNVVAPLNTDILNAAGSSGNVSVAFGFAYTTINYFATTTDTNSIGFEYDVNGVWRSVLFPDGTQYWNVGSAGVIYYTTPSSVPGINFGKPDFSFIASIRQAQWGNGGIGFSTGPGVSNPGHSAAIIGGSAQSAQTPFIHLYNTSDGGESSAPTNYERGVFDWSTTSNVLTIGTQKGGTGSTRNIQFVLGGTDVLDFGITNGNALTLLATPSTASGFISQNYISTLSGAGIFAGFYVKISGDTQNRIISALDASDRPFYSLGPGGSTAADVNLNRQGVGIIGIQNATVGNAAGLFVYRTSDTLNAAPSANYERGVFDWTTTSNVLTIGVQANGSGVVRPVKLLAGTGTGTTAQTTIDYHITNASDWTFTVPSGGHSIWLVNGTQQFVCQVGQGGGAPALDAQFGTISSGAFGIFTNNAASFVGVDSSGNFSIDPTKVYAFSSTTFRTSITNDTGISRSGAAQIALGNGTNGDASATIKAKTKAGAPTTSDVPAGTWVLIRDTTNATTKLYYNNAGTLQTVSLV